MKSATNLVKAEGGGKLCGAGTSSECGAQRQQVSYLSGSKGAREAGEAGNEVG